MPYILALLTTTAAKTLSLFGLLRTKMYLYGAIAFVAAGVLVGAYGAGYLKARADCHEKNLQSQVAELNRQIALLQQAQMIADKQLEEYQAVEAENDVIAQAIESGGKGDSPANCIGTDVLRSLAKLR